MPTQGRFISKARRLKLPCTNHSIMSSPFVQIMFSRLIWFAYAWIVCIRFGNDKCFGCNISVSSINVPDSCLVFPIENSSSSTIVPFYIFEKDNSTTIKSFRTVTRIMCYTATTWKLFTSRE